MTDERLNECSRVHLQVDCLRARRTFSQTTLLSVGLRRACCASDLLSRRSRCAQTTRQRARSVAEGARVDAAADCLLAGEIAFACIPALVTHVSFSAILRKSAKIALLLTRSLPN
jgi:hypothetical protein